MRPRLGRICAAAAALAAVGASGGAPATGGKDSAREAAELRRENAALSARANAAVLELYALETRLQRARARLEVLRRQVVRLEHERTRVSARLGAARDTLAASERFLAVRLRTLYEEGRADPLEVLLGAGSLDEALDGIDGLHFAAEQDAEIIRRTAATRDRLVRLAATLEARQARLAGLLRQAADRKTELEAARAARSGYLAELASERGLNLTRIAALEREARSARARAVRLAVPTAVAQVGPPPATTAEAPHEPEAEAESVSLPPSGQLRVIATGYSLTGRTATGLPTGRGVVAVDPSLIPLGTRLTIPGYGEGVAADIGSSVRGAKIDLWFPTRSEALRWGVRTVTITIHG